MKMFIGASIIVSVFLMIYVFLQYTVINQDNVYHDDEQKGLNKQIVINFSHVVAENTPKGLAAQKFAEIVNQKSDGKVKIEVYSNGVLYSDDEELAALRRNDVQMIAPSISKLTDLSPTWQLFDLPFIFDDYSEAKQVFTGKIGQDLLSTLQEKNIKGLALWSNGFKQMTSNTKPLLHPADFQGQTFRIMPSEVIKKQFELLGAKPQAVSFNKVYQSLERQEFDGQENTISNIYSKRLYELQKYMTISNHGYLGYAVLMDQKYWDSLPEDVKQLLSDAMVETTNWIWTQSKMMNDEQLQQIKNKSGMRVYYLNDTQKAEWKKQFNSLYQSFENNATKQTLDIIQQIKNIESKK
ncbi:DctP family TRAP transporter solute-binding subunit [Priestia megaterium]|uniref:DctP family TRAP transporter solute-binding subunit n=1 Tax=Priestia megaterium TaxID=1404 RepID=UPI0030023CB0